MRSINYDTLSEKYQHVYVQSGKLLEQECSMLEQVISFSFNQYYLLSGTKKLSEKEGSIAAFFYRNSVYLSAAYTMLRYGMPDPAGNNMRTIFETIIWEYAYLTDEEIYSNFREISQLEEEKFRHFRPGTWSNTKERSLENLRRKYNFQKMMKRLYSKELFEKLFFNQYWVLCQKSHSSIFGVNHNTPNMQGTTTLEKGPEELKNNLMALVYLSVENLICFLNCFSQVLSQAEINIILEFVNNMNRKIPPSVGLAPDTKDLKFTLRFKEL